ncbi:MAG: zeta toxin family protein [Clostridia bacterium]|nr:zeta toxin family protein [Clostridia bacterium]
MEEKTIIDNLIQMYGINDEKAFEIYEKNAEAMLTTGKRKSNDKTLIIVGGQSGAGKLRLRKLTQKQLPDGIVVDFDELKALHPSYKTVNELYPEKTHVILHRDTNEVKNRVLDYLIKEGYDVIYEGALRDTKGFVDLARNFKENGYKIKMNVMAVPKLESFGSTFFRYAFELLSDRTPRWVEKTAHDASYEGVIRTINELKNQGLTSDIGVYVRSIDEPKKIYHTQERQFPEAITAINYGREIGRKKAVQDFLPKYNMVKETLESRQPELVKRLGDWEELYNEEVKYFNEIDDMIIK